MHRLSVDIIRHGAAAGVSAVGGYGVSTARDRAPPGNGIALANSARAASRGTWTVPTWGARGPRPTPPAHKETLSPLFGPAAPGPRWADPAPSSAPPGRGR